MPDRMPTASAIHVYPPRRPPSLQKSARAFAGTFHSLVLLSLCIVFFMPSAAPGAETGSPWQARIAEHPAIPPYLIAVDKSRQELAFFERRSPLKLSRRFACTTGQAVGDKTLQGDLKTPEGIYFVGYRIGSGLDFIKYGHEAYTLNYPNPVDRLRKKTGYGIWIHGRGEPLVPLQTEGCVSMNNDDLALLGKVLVPGAPVALTGSYVYEPSVGPEDEATFILLRDKVEAWAKAWSDRSSDYFAFYDKEAYGIAQGESFAAFKAQKDRLFKMLPWIRTSVRDIQVLRGPDYWVTWFYQDYQAPNLSTRGVRRLYWGRNDKGEFKILGMEWHPGLSTSTLLASADSLLPPLEQPGPVWPGGLPDMTGESGELLVAARASQRAAVFSQEPAPSSAVADPGAGVDPAASATASTTDSASPAATLSSDGASLDDAPLLAQADIQQGQQQGLQQGFADHVESSARGNRETMARPSPEAVRIGRELNRQANGAELLDALRRQTDAARMGPSAKSASSRPALNLPPPLPSQGIGDAADLSPVTAQVAAPAPVAAPVRPEPVHVTPDPVQPEPSRPAPSRPETAAPSPDHAGADWLAGQAGPSPVQTDPVQTARPLPETDRAVAASPEFIASWVENWREAWQAGDLDLYVAFYAPKAKQGSRGSAASIRKQKERLWAGAAPASVELTDVSVTVQGKTATAVMRQTYRDTRGKGDFGQKTLTFQNINGVWLITQEDWSPLPDEAGH